MAVQQKPSPQDHALFEAVGRGLDFLPRDTCRIDLSWGTESGMWFTEVRSNAPGSADVDVSTDGDLINFNVANTWFEFAFEDEGLREVELLVESVACGRFAEAGPISRAFALFGTSEGEISGGAVHLPIPWGWRRMVRTFSPFSSIDRAS